MKIYIDNEKHCHTTNPDCTFKEIETDAFDGQCVTFVEGHCYDDSNGYIQVYPWKPYEELDNAQREYERAMLAQQDETIAELDALVLNLQYDNLINN